MYGSILLYYMLGIEMCIQCMWIDEERVIDYGVGLTGSPAECE